MSVWTDAMVREALGLEGEAAPELRYTGVSTDTRSIEPGSLFVALSGERFDAHAFLADAAARGATGAVVARVPEDTPAGLARYVVEDTLVALGRLARFHRRTLSARVSAITGSNGKTTTKELARAALGARYRVHATTGNLNNLVGVPLTLLAAPADAEALVIEMGTNAPGEVARLAEIVEPDVAIVTSIGEEHLEGLHDLEGVLREETAVLDALGEEGVALVADEPAELAERARALAATVRVAGWSERADAALRAEDIRLAEDGTVRFRWQGREVALALRGRHSARNALLALGLAVEWGVEADAAVAALRALQPGRMRGEFHRYGEILVLSDCYNANPPSVAAAIDTLAAMPRRGGRVAVLGTMLELGPRSAEIHAATAAVVARAGLDVVVATGAFTAAFEPLRRQLGERLLSAEDPLDAFDLLVPRLRGDEVILLKGSRGVALERLLPRFEQHWGTLRPHGEAFGPRESNARAGMRDEARPAERFPGFSAESANEDGEDVVRRTGE